ncbi:MAG: HD-GYP domain-containing protein [Deltaproteobacteria bacterium]|nr:HD-GYP domain-containing protein [Candidatus Zymogenaceae bacterium]
MSGTSPFSIRADRNLPDVSFYDFIEALSMALDARDPYTAGHSYRVADTAELIALAMGYPDEYVSLVHIAGYLHDIGKLAVNANLFIKPDKLTIQEFAEVQRHPGVGSEIIKKVRGLEPLVNMVLHHHERWIGMGYPLGISGEDIDQGARILAVADSLDSLVIPKPFRSAVTIEEAREEIKRSSGRMFDPAVVDAFLEIPSSVIQEIHRKYRPAVSP